MFAADVGRRAIMVPDLLSAMDEIRILCDLAAADLHEVRALLQRGAESF
jgi:hypothetical protein